MAVVDGLGHGDQARQAGQKALSALRLHGREPLVSLVRRCHDRLGNTRGATMPLAFIEADNSTMTWIGVGNVEARLLRARPTRGGGAECLALRSGVVGYHLPALLPSVAAVAKGDLLILATDGLGTGFSENVILDDPPQGIADRILDRHFKGTDDALVLVAQYLGPSK